MEFTLTEDHKYFLGNRRLIGVTEALSVVDNRWKVDPYYLERGTAIHLACEYHDRGTLDEDSLDPQIVPYVQAYQKFLEDTGFKPIWIEKKLAYPAYGYAGTLDRIGCLNERNVLIDLKSGEHNPLYDLQASAYWKLCEANGLAVKGVFDLYLKNNGTYSLREVRDPKKQWTVFLAALTVYVWKNNI